MGKKDDWTQEKEDSYQAKVRKHSIPDGPFTVERLLEIRESNKALRQELTPLERMRHNVMKPVIIVD